MTGKYDYRAASRRGAVEIVPLLVQSLRPQSVIDVGCGIGAWLRVFADHGVPDYLGIDGSWVDPAALSIPPHHFLVIDISKPFDLGRTYDVAISCEVGEHLNADHADQYVTNLARLAPIVVFSAAIPYQAGVPACTRATRHGTSHINEQWPSYWAHKFAQHNFTCFDVLRPRVWDNASIPYYYRQNLLIFAASVEPIIAGTMLDPFMKDAFRGPPMSLVHPEKYLQTASLEHVSLRRLLHKMPRLLLERVRRRILGKIKGCLWWRHGS